MFIDLQKEICIWLSGININSDLKKKIYSSKPKERKCKKRKEKKANIYLLLWNMKV